VFLLNHNYPNGGFHYRKKFKPNVKKNRAEQIDQAKRKVKLYTEDWDVIRRNVYVRDGHRCVLCSKKGKLNCHHIIPVKISKDNSMSNLVSTCDKCHRRLEAIGYAILDRGGSTTDIRRAELEIISEARKTRLAKYMEKREMLLEEKKEKENETK
jgi:5-methylcytosine-specific restriction endonuclease McrA